MEMSMLNGLTAPGFLRGRINAKLAQFVVRTIRAKQRMAQPKLIFEINRRTRIG
jgi:hypothetical protein